MPTSSSTFAVASPHRARGDRRAAPEEIDELAARHPLIKGVLFGTQADITIQWRVVRAMAQHAHFALAGPKLAGRQLRKRAFARAVGPEQARHPGGNAERRAFSRR